MTKYLLIPLLGFFFHANASSQHLTVTPENARDLGFSYCEHAGGTATVMYPTLVEESWIAIATIVKHNLNGKTVFITKTELGKANSVTNRVDFNVEQDKELSNDVSLTITYHCESNCNDNSIRYYNLRSINAFYGTDKVACL